MIGEYANNDALHAPSQAISPLLFAPHRCSGRQSNSMHPLDNPRLGGVSPTGNLHPKSVTPSSDMTTMVMMGNARTVTTRTNPFRQKCLEWFLEVYGM